jgi:hypothetical protein
MTLIPSGDEYHWQKMLFWGLKSTFSKTHKPFSISLAIANLFPDFRTSYPSKSYLIDNQ